MNILIMAGGSGTRLWPASRQAKPKQLLKLFGNRTLLQNTYERFSGLAPAKNIYIGATKNYAASIKKQLPKIPKNNFSLEPVLRDRGPAIGLAALIIQHHNPGSVFVTAWSDHDIKPKPTYLNILRRAERFLNANPEYTLIMGVKPAFPHTGMGHIQYGNQLRNAQGLHLYKATKFKEKPNLATAQKFMKQGNYLWNTGIFMWRTDTLLNFYKLYLPEVYKLLMKIKPALGTSRQQKIIDSVYPKMPEVDIESGLLEKLKNNMAAIQADFQWADVGNWKVVKDIQASRLTNFSRGLHVDHESRDLFVRNDNSKQLVATIGLESKIVVVTPEAILVADKNQAEEVKKIINQLKANPGLVKFL